MSDDAAVPTAKPRISSTQWIAIAMVLGIVAGYLMPAAQHPDFMMYMKATSSVFLRMIKSLIVPLLFATLVVGIAGHGDDMKKVGRLAFRSIVYFEVVTTLALAVGLIAVNVIKPGSGISLAEATPDKAAEFAQNAPSFGGVIEHMVPQSFFDAAARNEVLQIVFFSILFAVALSRVKGDAKETMLKFCESLSEVMFKFVGLVMAFAPFGIGAAIATTVGTSGLGVLKSLGLLVLTLYGALVVFLLLVLVPVAIIAKIPIRTFWTFAKQPWLIAFSTASSEAVYPKLVEEMERFGCNNKIVSFVLPLGYSFNLDGSMMYMTFASMFIAQAFNITSITGDVSQQIIMLLVFLVTSKGIAGVPRASLVVVLATGAMFGLPPEGVGLILAIDVFCDMGRTMTNVLGNALATAAVSKWEGQLEYG